MTQGYNGASLATEQPEPICIHVWRDQSEKDGVIIQECIRCKKTRTLSIN